MTKLLCTSSYHNTASGDRWEPGATVECTPDKAAFLLHDAPGCFELQMDESADPGDDLAVVAAKLNALTVTFAVKADEKGELRKPIAPARVVSEINNATGLRLPQGAIEHEPLRQLGEFAIGVRLAEDVTASVKVIVQRKGEAPPAA